MIKPPDIEDDNWEIIVAAATGDAPKASSAFGRRSYACRRGYFYMPPIYFAVREGHAEIVRISARCRSGLGMGRRLWRQPDRNGEGTRL